MKVAIIGSGSFGCTIGNVFSNLGHDVKIWSFKKEEADTINNKHTCMFIENSKLNKNIKCYTNYEDVIYDSEYIFLVTPSSVIRKTCMDIKEYCKDKKIIICSKGLEKNTNKLLSEIVIEELENENIGILSGPSIAKEVIENKHTSVVFASKNENLNKEIKDLFSSKTFKIETSTDIIGVEIGGSFKNIAALSIGMIKGLNLGENIKATLMTKILEEIATIGISLGAKKDTFYGLSGLGDLIVTCSSSNSRNNRAGVLLAQGKSIDKVKEEIGMVIEGLDALEIAYDISKKLNLKIIPTIYKIIYEKNKVEELINLDF